MLEVKVELNVRDLCGLSDVRCCVFVSFERSREREGKKRERKKERQFKESKLSCENTSKKRK
jgi:hypothetical protein